MPDFLLLLLGLLNYGFLLLAFLTTKMMSLRIFTILSGSFGMLYYGYTSFQERVMWVNLFWAGLFIIVNVIQFYLLVKASKQITLSPIEKEIYKKYFSELSEPDFYKLVSNGSIVDAEPGEKLTELNRNVHRLLFLISGEANVIINGKQVGQCSAGNFIGEFSFILDQPATATVVVNKAANYIMWMQEDLKKILSESPEMEHTIKKLLKSDLITKIKQYDPKAKVI